jgi:hypothetical protein
MTDLQKLGTLVRVNALESPVDLLPGAPQKSHSPSKKLAVL